MKTYIHYGSGRFDKFFMISTCHGDKMKNLYRNKPGYGLWASPTDTDWGWKDWCESEDYGDLSSSFTFSLKDDAKILVVNSVKDVEDYIQFDPERYWTFKLDFERIMDEYDGMELIHGNNYSELHDGGFYTWDCDSICIWNPEVIVNVR